MRRGLTLIELIVVLAVIGLSLALVLPAVRASQDEAARAVCADNLKEIALASHNYASANGCLPMSEVLGGEGEHGVGHSAFTAVIPFMDLTPIYNAYNFSVENWHEANTTAVRTNIRQFLCPENEKSPALVEAKDVFRLEGGGFPGSSQFARNHYGVNWGGGHKGYGDDFLKEKGAYRGVILPVPAKAVGKTTHNVRFAEITDGTSNTLAFVEKRDGSGWAVGGWSGSEFDVPESPDYSGDDAQKRRAFTGSPHDRGPTAALCDGSVKTIAKTIDRKVWYALMTRDGGEIIKAGEIDGDKP